MAQLKSSTQERLDLKAPLDANNEVPNLPSGAAQQAAAGLGAGYRRADGTWAKVATSLPQDFPLQIWADNLVSGVVYNTYLTAAQNGLPTGDLFIEVLRYSTDTAGNQYRVIRATSFGAGIKNTVYQSTNTNGTWTPFYQFAINTPLNWVASTLVNGWTNYLSTFVGYSQDSTGLVSLAGYVAGGSNATSTIIYTLPVGMRPHANADFSVPMSGGVGRVSVSPNGGVMFVGGEPHTGDASVWLAVNTTFKGVQ